MKHHTTILLLAALALVAPRASFAYNVDLNGFFTVGYARSNTDTVFLRTIDKSGDFSRVTNAGLQATAALSDRLMVKVQGVASGRIDDALHLDLDLAQARYLVTPHQEVLVGRIRLPLYMISEYRMVGALYPWTLPPPEVYEVLPIESVGSNETFIGANLISRYALGRGWELETQAYAGGSSRSLTPPNRTINATAKHIAGGEVATTKGLLTVRASYLHTLNQSTTTEIRGGSAPTTSDTSLGQLQLLTGGVRFEPGAFFAQGEFANVLGENPRFKKISSHYETVGYRFFKRTLLTHFTFSQILGESQTTENLKQHTLTGGFDFFIDSSFVVKLEMQRVYPAAPPAAPPPPPGAPAGGGQGGSGLFSSQPSDAFNVYYVSFNAAF